jgi:hypothetical protein
MINNINTIKDFSTETTEGKLLLAALAILTSIDEKDIKDKKWGGWVHPDIAIQQVTDLTNKIYYEEEWKQYQTSKSRDDKISDILK